MSERKLPTTYVYQPPATTRSNSGSLPDLPSSSGKWWLSPARRLRADTNYIHDHASFLRARTQQADAARGLVHARTELALTLSRLDQIDELCHHERERGRLSRETTILDAKADRESAVARLLQAQQYRASLQPPAPVPAASSPPASAPPSRSTGVTPDDVERFARQIPEMAGSPEAIRTLSLLLHGLLAEKNR